jgi:hypothetical protein
VPDYTYDHKVVVNPANGELVKNATGGVLIDSNGDPQSVRDTSGAPLAGLSTDRQGLSQPFIADIPNGRVVWGAVPPLPVISNEALGSPQEVAAARAAAQAAQAAAEVAAAAAQAADASVIAGRVGALEVQTPTVEELCASAFLSAGALGATGSFPLLTAKFPLRVVAASVVQWDTVGGVLLDNTNYWTVEVRRVTNANAVATIASKNTTSTSGEVWPHRADWNFDNVVFHAANQVFNVGDTCDVAFFRTGTPTGPSKVTATIRYEPI